MTRNQLNGSANSPSPLADLLLDPTVLGSILEAVPDGLVITEDDGLIVLVNQRLEELFGYDRGELLGRKVEMLLPENVRSAHRSHRLHYGVDPAVRYMGSGLRLSGRHRDGHEFPVEVALSPLASTDAPNARVIATVRDVSEQRGLTESLRASEERFRAAFDQAPVPMAVTALENPTRREIVEANQALADLLGYSREDLIGRAFADLTHPDDREADESAASAMLDGSAPGRLVREKRYRAADGRIVWAELNATCLTDRHGRTAVSLSHIFDITDRKAVESERSRHERFLDALATVTTELLGDLDEGDASDVVAHHARALLDADLATIVELAHEDEIHVLGVDGSHADAWRGTSRPSRNAPLSTEVIRRRIPIVLELPEVARDMTTHDTELTAPFGPILSAPLGDHQTNMALVALRATGRVPFDEDDLAVATQFAEQVAVAMELARSRRAQKQLQLFEERERIARDLHDRVIQTLFATGMSLQAGISAVHEPIAHERMTRAVDDIDSAIKELRSAIFTLNHSFTKPDALRRELTRIVDRAADVLGFRPQLAFRGDPLELSAEQTDDVMATLNEALSNIARHAHASRCDITVDSTTTSLVLELKDDGVGVDPDRPRGNGLDNMANRAVRHGGNCDIVANPCGGTILRWHIPLPQ
jgi:PAS domain S-box-containing protein